MDGAEAQSAGAVTAEQDAIQRREWETQAGNALSASLYERFNRHSRLRKILVHTLCEGLTQKLSIQNW
jgi:predicted NAD-dependent protein-ADP-ribosyltransferase YbiA (DUF1768 family)